jgi:hypothetical protein
MRWVALIGLNTPMLHVMTGEAVVAGFGAALGFLGRVSDFLDAVFSDAMKSA